MIRRVWLNLSIRAKGLVVVVIPTVALLLASLLFYKAEGQEREAQRWLNHSLEVRSKIQQVHNSLLETEARLRGYFLTGQHDPQVESALARNRMQRDIADLQTLVHENPRQVERSRRLAIAVKKKQDHMAHIVGRYRPLAPDHELAIGIGESRTLLEEPSSLLTAMLAEEVQRTEEQRRYADQTHATLQVMMVSGLVIGVLGGLLASLLFSVGIDKRVRNLEFSARSLAEGQLVPSFNSDGNDALSNLQRELERAGQLLVKREADLRETNSYLNHLIAAMPGMLFRLDAVTLKILYASPNSATILGYSPEEICETPNFYAQTIHPDDRERIMVELARGLQNESVLVETERRFRHKDGHYVWLYSYVRGEYDEATGKVVGLLTYTLDVTQRKRTEDALRENEERFRNSFDFAPIGIGLMSIEGEWRQVNHALCEILGYFEKDLLQRPLQTLVYPGDVAADIEQRRRLLADGVSFYQVEQRYIHRCGHIVWAQLSVSLVRDSQQRPLYFITQFQDISDRKRIEVELSQAHEAALQSVRVKTNFMANMSHEIRTPMNGIIGMVELLQATALSNAQRDFVDTINESASSLLVIINDILDFSKIEAGKLPMDATDFDLGLAVESSISLLAPKAHESGLHLASLIHRDVPTLLHGDTVRLRQVMLNLLGNAIKFTEQGEVTLRITRETETETDVVLCFAIRDSGIGIDEKTQADLFHPFAQADTTTTRRYGGTGLGLAISKQLVELMGGQIGIRSKVGKGSTFWFTARFDKQRKNQFGRDEERMVRWRVLIIDENQLQRQMVEQQIASWNCRCDGAANGVDGLEKLHQEFRRGDPYDIVMIDSRLADIRSAGLIEIIHSQAPINATRLIVMTRTHEDTTALSEAGADYLLTRPIRQSQLFDVLAQVMEKKGPPLLPELALPEHSAAPIQKLHILVAEDNQVNQKVVRNQLENMGHRVVIVENGNAAVQEWARGQFDLILMDCHMPEMDGYAASRAIRRQEESGQHIPIIALTANALTGDREKCLAAGMDAHLTKPIKKGDLEATIVKQVLGDATTTADIGISPNDGDLDIRKIPTVAAEVLDQKFDLPILLGERISELKEELDSELLQDLAELFIREMPGLMDDIRRAGANEDAAELRAAAHKFRGSCSMLGAARMEALCREIEEQAGSGDLETMGFLIERLAEECIPIEKALDVYSLQESTEIGMEDRTDVVKEAAV